MLAFYMDHQFRASVARALRQRNIDVLTAQDDGSARLEDEALLERATKLSRVLVTHDQGFLRIAAEWQTSKRGFAGIAFAIQKSFVVAQAVEYLELMAHTISAEEMANHVEYIPKRK